MKKTGTILIVAILCILILLAFTWVSILKLRSPEGPSASHFPWPIACSLKGCLTSKSWALQRSYDIAFAEQTRKSMPTNSETLTTAMRRHLINHAKFDSPVTAKDAVRYRTAILHNTDISTLKPLGMFSFAEYDNLVVLPFLRQEALMQQRDIKNTDDLYGTLAQEQRLSLLLFHYKWHADRGVAEEQ